MIQPLTSLRFFAAMMVVLHHYAGFSAGYAGVSFFYVLSGFVLALNYAGRTETWAERRDFWVRRVARVYPAHLATLALMLPLGGSLLVLPINAALLQSWVPMKGVYFSFNGPSWSISNEAFFYAAFPFLFGLLRSRVLGLWAGLLIALAAAFAAFALDRSLESPPIHFLFYIFPLTRLFEFALGMALAVASRPSFGLRGEIAALALAAASLALAYAPLPGSFTAALIFIPGAVALVVVFASSAGPVSRVLSHRALVRLGEASFALYMLHIPLKSYFPGAGWWLAGVAVALSLAFHRWFEMPSQHLVLRLSGLRR